VISQFWLHIELYLLNFKVYYNIRACGKKEKKKRFDSYYLEIRKVKNSEIFTMALVQCKILHLTVKSLFFNFFNFFGIFRKDQRFRGGNWQKRAWNFRG
jgi:hypothetical protein